MNSSSMGNFMNLVQLLGVVFALSAGVSVCTNFADLQVRSGDRVCAAPFFTGAFGVPSWKRSARRSGV